MSSEPFEPGSNWVPLRAGWITATGGPSRARLASWPGRGATDVLTLQRGDEMQPWIPDLCREHGLQFIHLPLSGRRMDQVSDFASLAQLRTLLATHFAPQKTPRRVVVHCSAGLHRTGAVCYLLLRLAGLDRAAALAQIQLARALTAEELQKPTRAGVLADHMDARLASL